jgi:hypothetical protein
MNRGSGIKDRDERSRGMDMYMTETVAKSGTRSDFLVSSLASGRCLTMSESV